MDNKKYKKTDCELYGSEQCKTLNMESCAACSAALMSKHEIDGVNDDIEAIHLHLPSNIVASMRGSRECLLCKGEHKGKRECYALFDMVQPDIERDKRSFLGYKTKMYKGVLFTLQIASCNDCRKRYMRLKYMPATTALLICAIVLIALSIRPIFELLSRDIFALPLIVMLAAVCIAILCAAIMKSFMIKKYSRYTKFNIFDVDGMTAMKEEGWFELNTGNGMSNPVFSHRRLKKGTFTGSESNNDIDIGVK